jgi:hypothetical protein
MILTLKNSAITADNFSKLDKDNTKNFKEPEELAEIMQKIRQILVNHPQLQLEIDEIIEEKGYH